MKQFLTIFKFELSSYLKNKIFIGITALMMVLIIGALSFPRITELFSEEPTPDIETEVEDPDYESSLDTEVGENQGSIIYVLDETLPFEETAMTELMFNSIMFDNTVIMTEDTPEELEEKVANGECEAAIILHSATEFTYIVDDVIMYDSTEYLIQEVMLQKYQFETMVTLGLSEEEASEVLNATIVGEVITLGKNQMDNFFYTYILIFGLYMAILLYGQFVATGVATEKSSRAMELLVTSAKTDNLMFGKVLGAGTAGFMQIIAILGTAFIAYGLNESYWADNWLVQSLFDMPLYILIYTVIFFILGFAIYSFLYGAVGSLASKVEDVNTSVLPITFLFIIAFFIVINGMTSGNVDSILMIVASYFPFTSPMAMFTRIAMGNVAMIEIVISIIILIISTIGIGIFSAKIYRVGVLMYGKSPKIKEIVKMLIKKQ